jgi:tetratricopeptide (TPR) repeat protein
MFAVLSVGIWGGWSMLRRGRLAEGERSIRTAIEQLDVWQRGTATLAYAEAMVGRVLLERGETEQALAVVERALTGPTGTEGGRLLVEVKADILLDDGRVADALELLEASVRRTPHLVNPVWRADRQAWCVAAAGVGRHGEALASAQDLVAIAGRWGAPSTVGEALLTLGRVQELVPGQDGVETLTSAATVLAGTDRPVLHAHALTALGAALAGRGDPGADAVLDRAEGIAAACEALRVVRAVGEIRQRDAGVAAAVSR